MRTRLSICIPTYNRQRFLDILLGSIRDALQDDFRDAVEVCISDNASTDGSAGMIADWRARGHFVINYAISPTNVGPDRNYMAAAALAGGDYIWFMGSDDTVAPDSIARLLKMLEQQPRQFIVSNRLDCTYDMQPLKQMRWLPSVTSDTDFDFSDDRQLECYLDRSVSIGAIFSYLSSIIVENKAWRSIRLNESYIGGYYSHVYVCLKLVAAGARLRYVVEPLVHNRSGNDSFLDAGEVARVMIDLRGYVRLADEMFESRPVIRSKILRVLARERPPVYTAFFLARRAQAAEWREAIPFLRRIGTPMTILWWLSVFPSTARMLHTPIIRSLARKFLGRRR